MNKLFDNKFWYIGFTYAEFGGTEFEKCPCVIVRNPFGKWKSLHKRNHDKWMKDNEYAEAYREQFNESSNRK